MTAAIAVEALPELLRQHALVVQDNELAGVTWLEGRCGWPADDRWPDSQTHEHWPQHVADEAAKL